MVPFDARAEALSRLEVATVFETLTLCGFLSATLRNARTVDTRFAAGPSGWWSYQSHGLWQRPWGHDRIFSCESSSKAPHDLHPKGLPYRCNCRVASIYTGGICAERTEAALKIFLSFRIRLAEQPGFGKKANRWKRYR
jgi:hypothetical protein